MDQWVFIPSSCGIKCMERHCFETSSWMRVGRAIPVAGTNGKD